ncbi:pentapeptide repeat protein [Micromonospora violae]|uniref:Pentapeptide repeat protein n=1 Tax=Micromonospora violae TaxID=1278207 RepID=A0A4Q7URI9_9ACTN|nr:pentapeptide repeat-containing protein [Micromonospora violae]RZT82529.1 pentapeptide repeat protein [Micromonospora violae]
MKKKLVGFGLLLFGFAAISLDLTLENLIPIGHALAKMADHWLIALGAAGLGAGLWMFRQVRNASSDRSDVKNSLGTRLLSDYGITVTACIMVLIGCVTLLVMLQVAGNATSKTDRSRLQIESIKYGLGIAASGGAVAALLLAVRRQRLSESMHQLAIQTQAHTEADAAERRVTELYTKAVEQLGSPDAAVRLGGMYALERVAQSNIGQRQTVVNVFCAYLRMPYTPPSKLPPTVDAAVVKEAKEELEVRSGAQDILTKHLEELGKEGPMKREDLPDPSPSSWFWPGMSINLAGAYLRDFRILRGYVETAKFSGAIFAGEANFESTCFHSASWWHDVTFQDHATFRNADFYVARFDGKTVFDGPADFTGVRFRGVAWFNNVKFQGKVSFSNADFLFKRTQNPRMLGAHAIVKADGQKIQHIWPEGWHLREAEGNSNYGVLARTKAAVPQSRLEIEASADQSDNLS